MNSGNSKTFDPCIIDLSYKLNLKREDKYVAFWNLSIHYKFNFSGNHTKNKFKISALTWNEGFQLPDGSYSASNIKDYFEYF